MAYAIIRHEKYKAKDVNRVYGESVRNFKLAKCVNSSIDPEKISDNVYLGLSDLESPLRYIKQYHDNNNISGRFNLNTGSDINDTNIMCQFFVGLSSETLDCMSDREIDEYFISAMRFIISRFPSIEIINVALHKDETAGYHMHFNYMPIYDDPDTGKRSFNINRLMPGKHFMHDLQDAFYDWMSSCFPDLELQRGKIDSDRVHYTVKEYKELQGQLESLNEQIEQKRQELEQVDGITPDFSGCKDVSEDTFIEDLLL